MAIDYYAVLGISPDAGGNEISQAFRRLAKTFHPDVDRRPGATARFQKINEAYQTLSDPVKRAEYDRMRQREARLSNPNTNTNTATTKGTAVTIEFDNLRVTRNGVEVEVDFTAPPWGVCDHCQDEVLWGAVEARWWDREQGRWVEKLKNPRLIKNGRLCPNLCRSHYRPACFRCRTVHDKPKPRAGQSPNPENSTPPQNQNPRYDRQRKDGGRIGDSRRRGRVWGRGSR